MSVNISVYVQQGDLKNMKIPIHEKQETTSQRVKESAFQICKNLVSNPVDTTFIDCFSGSGQMGIEALSRNYKKVLFFEKSFLRISELSKWLNSKRSISNKSYKVIKRDMLSTLKSASNVEDWLKKDLDLLEQNDLNENLEVVLYLDPPYKTFWGNPNKVYNFLQSIKFVLDSSCNQKKYSLLWVCQAPSPKHKIWKEMGSELQDQILSSFSYSRQYGKTQLLIAKS